MFNRFLRSLFEGVFVERGVVWLLVRLLVFDGGRGLFAVLGEGFAGEEDDLAGGGAGDGRRRGFIGFSLAGFVGIERIGGAGVLGVGEAVIGATAAAGAAAATVAAAFGALFSGAGITGSRNGFGGGDRGRRRCLESGRLGGAGFAGITRIAAAVPVPASPSPSSTVAIPVPVTIPAAAIGGGGRILNFL